MNSRKTRRSPPTTMQTIETTRPIWMEVVETVADEAGADPADLPPLYETIDPEGLAGLPTARGSRLEFTYCGYEVTVRPDSSVTVDRAANRTGSSGE